ncbi:MULTISPECIES: PDC sensor domain-containing protein [Dickeya]|uniref:Uncharacterized protein n=1 Tax=Dickeya aquatica TaxID=1401087 RepID=A0A375AG30_9GAMM|nr:MULTISPECIES: PDC sensor domain-containing protein [Dickeya]SLM64876.1 FIG00613665: hypothetical protein [Dickeya aquatica]
MTRLSTRGALAEAVFASLIFVALLGFSTYMVYHKSINALEQEIKIGLLSTVRAAASTLAGEQFQTISANTSRDDPHYQQLAAQLERIRQASQDVRYIYTTIQDDEQVRFVVNPSPQNDNDGDGLPDLPPALMQVYDHAPAELVSALQRHQTGVSDQPYRDEWGIFISAYAPFYDSHGTFCGVLAMDLELSSFYQRLEALNQVFRKAIITIVFLGLVVGLAVWWMRRNSQQVREQLVSRDSAYAALLQATSPLQLARMHDWPLPLCFLRGGPPAAPAELPVYHEICPAPFAWQQHDLHAWWQAAAAALAPCPRSTLTLHLTGPLEAHFSPDYYQHFWQHSLQLWRQLVQQPLVIDVRLHEEALLHWVISIHLTFTDNTAEKPASDEADPGWWPVFLHWQGQAESAQVTLFSPAKGHLCLHWRVAKFPEGA